MKQIDEMILLHFVAAIERIDDKGEWDIIEGIYFIEFAVL